MKLHTLKPAAGSVKIKKRLGRGQGSGMGNTSTRGHKGAKSRSGYKTKSGFEGGQMPLQRRVPKFGFNKADKVVMKAINLDTLELLAQKGITLINFEALRANGLVAKSDKVKILSRGVLSTVVNVEAHAFSKSAIESIEKVGGKATVL
jgi:large subunit ribosomal protein L15